MPRLSFTQIEVLRHLVRYGHGRVKQRTADGLVRLGLAERIDPDVPHLIRPTDEGRAVERAL